MLNIDDLFKGRHFDREIIVLCVRWYLRYKLSFRDLVEIMAERGFSLAHTTIMRWIHRYAPEFERALEPLRSPGWTVLAHRRNLRQNQRRLDLSLSSGRQRGKDRRFPAARQAERRCRLGVLPTGFQGPGATAA
jgi:hypothetical protein